MAQLDAPSERCSTPFGITEYIGEQYVALASLCYKCSTPFGITEYIGRYARRSDG